MFCATIPNSLDLSSLITSDVLQWYSSSRYGKLKLVALKLKKRTVEQEAKIKELQANAGAGGNSKHLATLTKNCASLQARYTQYMVAIRLRVPWTMVHLSLSLLLSVMFTQ